MVRFPPPPWAPHATTNAHLLGRRLLADAGSLPLPPFVSVTTPVAAGRVGDCVLLRHPGHSQGCLHRTLRGTFWQLLGKSPLLSL